MSTCDYCGEEIVFRYVDGVLRPIHLHGGWCTAATSHRTYGPVSAPATPAPSYRISSCAADDMCRPTTCPICGERVFFVRHNGGAVWFDELGYPWPKHACFDDDLPSGFRVRQTADHVQTGSRSMVLGLVVRVRPTPAAGLTMLAIVLETRKGRCVSVDGDAESLLGELVTINSDVVVDAEGREFRIRFPHMDPAKGFDLPRDWLDNPT